MTYYNLTKLAEEKSDNNQQSFLSSPKTHMGLGGLALAGSAIDAYKNNPYRKNMLEVANHHINIMKDKNRSFFDKDMIDAIDRTLISRADTPKLDRLIAGGELKDTDNAAEYLKKIQLRKMMAGRTLGAVGAAGLGYGLYKHLKNKDK